MSESTRNRADQVPPDIFELRRADGFTISDDPSRIDLDIVHAYLVRSYWSPGITRERVEQAMRNSLPFGVYSNEGQVGYARVVTDRTSFAYLADVFILEHARGSGLGKWLVKSILSHPALQTIRRFVLITRDAHGLYE